MDVEEQFLRACAEGRADDVRDFLAPHPVLAHKPDAFHIAVANAHEDVLRLLLPHLSTDDLSVRDHWGCTVLHIAARQCLPRIVQLLLDRCPELVNITRPRGTTALHLSSREGDADSMAILIANRAAVNARRDDGATPLHMAAFNNWPGALQLLLGEGADPNLETDEGYTALQMAVEKGSDVCVTLLLPKTTCASVVKALLTACEKNNSSLVTALAAHTHLEDEQRDSVLLKAAAFPNCSLPTFKALLRAGANLSALNACHRNVLHVAAAANNKTITDHLLTVCEGLKDARDSVGATPLHLATASGAVETVSCLLEANADVTAQQTDLNTPLHIAARSGHVSVTQLLLNWLVMPRDAGALNAHLESPVHLSVMNAHPEVLELLLTAGAEVDDKLRTLVWRSKNRDIQHLVEVRGASD